MASLDDLERLLLAIQDEISNLRRAQVTSNQVVVTGGLSDLSENLGIVRAGQFLALKKGFYPEDTDATGAFVSATPVEFGGTSYNVGAVKDGKPQAGFNTNGDFAAAGEQVLINNDGVVMKGRAFPIRFTDEEGAEVRETWMGMNLDDGDTAPAFNIIYSEADGTNLILNPSFESGTTNWTISSGWASSIESPYVGTYCMKLTPVYGVTTYYTLTSDMVAATAGNSYVVSAYVRMGAGTRLYGTVEFYDGATFLNSVDFCAKYDSGLTGVTRNWVQVTGIGVAPLTTTQMRIVFSGANYWSNIQAGAMYVDNIILYESGVNTKIKIDNKVDINTNTNVTGKMTVTDKYRENLYRCPPVRDQLLPPSSFTVAVTATAGNVNVGTHYYRIAWEMVTPYGSGITNSSGQVTATVTTSAKQVTVNSPVVWPHGVKLKIYRTTAGGSIFYWLANMVSPGAYTDNTSDAALATHDIMGTENTTSLFMYPRRADWFFGDMYGDALTRTIDGSQMYNGYWMQTSNQSNDEWYYSVFLAAGTYRLKILGETWSGHGKLDVYVDNIAQITGMDWYSATQVRNVEKYGTIEILDPGYHVIKFAINGTSGSAYIMRLTRINIMPELAGVLVGD